MKCLPDAAMIADHRHRLAEVQAQLKAVLDREADNIRRADAKLGEVEAERDGLLASLVEILGPLKVCYDNPNVRDDTVLPIDMTMGELRRARAAIAKAKGRAA